MLAHLNLPVGCKKSVIDWPRGIRGWLKHFEIGNSRKRFSETLCHYVFIKYFIVLYHEQLRHKFCIFSNAWTKTQKRSLTSLCGVFLKEADMNWWISAPRSGKGFLLFTWRWSRVSQGEKKPVDEATLTVHFMVARSLLFRWLLNCIKNRRYLKLWSFGTCAFWTYIWCINVKCTKYLM